MIDQRPKQAFVTRMLFAAGAVCIQTKRRLGECVRVTLGALRGTQSKAPPPARRRGEHGGGDACASARPARCPASSRGGSSQQNHPYLGPLHRRGRGPGFSQVPRRSIMIRAGVRARLRDAPDGSFHKHGNRPVEACRYSGPTLLGGATLNQHGAGPRLRAWDPCPPALPPCLPTTGRRQNPEAGRPPTRLQEAQVTQGQLCATRGGPTLLGGATLTR